MPVKPYLLEDIEELVVRGETFETELGVFFSSTSLDEERLQQINEQVSSIKYISLCIYMLFYLFVILK
ncbi:hypothetical protein EON65_16225 [archaeon]|nr:MAG: hypothetical protein EON65_16225 [archaeon]